MQNSAINKKNNFNKVLVLFNTTLLLTLFLAFPNNKLQAQDDKLSTFLKIKLNDRSDFIGELLRESKDSIILKKENGVIVNLLRSDIRYSYKVQPGKIRNGRYRPDLFNYDKGFVNPTAFGPKKGAVYFENNMLVWNELNVGLNDYISLRLGFDTWGMAMRLFEDYDNEYYEPVTLIAPKFSFPVIEEKWQFAFSTAAINVPDDDGYLDYGVLFLSNSFGNKNNNFTIGLGAQIFGGDGAFENSYLTFSGSIRMAPRIILTTENWIIANRSYNDDIDYFLLFSSLGIKQIGQRLNWSISVLRFGEGGDYTSFIPILGVALPISRGGAWKS